LNPTSKWCTRSGSAAEVTAATAASTIVTVGAGHCFAIFPWNELVSLHNHKNHETMQRTKQNRCGTSTTSSLLWSLMNSHLFGQTLAPNQPSPAALNRGCSPASPTSWATVGTCNLGDLCGLCIGRPGVLWRHPTCGLLSKSWRTPQGAFWVSIDSFF
jgi:hypothetical protein